MGVLFIFTNSCKKDNNTTTTTPTPTPLVYGSMTDIDGNTYKTIKIGTLTWMAENLNVTHYSNGDAIPNVIDSIQWNNTFTGAYCDYRNLLSNSTIYGKLYNWYAINNGSIAPIGWHVATDIEWTMLSDYLGGIQVSGGKLKETGTSHWLSPNLGATNETGFTALPGGCHVFSQSPAFTDINVWGYWWSSTNYSTNEAYFCMLRYDTKTFFGFHCLKPSGYSVRCVKD